MGLQAAEPSGANALYLAGHPAITAAEYDTLVSSRSIAPIRAAENQVSKKYAGGFANVAAPIYAIAKYPSRLAPSGPAAYERAGPCLCTASNFTFSRIEPLRGG